MLALFYYRLTDEALLAETQLCLNHKQKTKKIMANNRNKTSLLSGCTKEVKASKFLDRNTLRIQYADGSIAVRLHDTDIITKDVDGNIILDSGGWRTKTTKERMERYGDLRIWQEKGIWMIGCKDLNGENTHTEFYDGIKFSTDLTLLSGEKLSDMSMIEKTKKQISKFVSLITRENLPVPDAGDCWFCSLRTEDGKTMGEIANDVEHLKQHINEKYMHGSLLVNAMRERGYNDDQIRTHYSIRVADTFRRAVRTYLQKRLIPNLAVR